MDSATVQPLNVALVIASLLHLHWLDGAISRRLGRRAPAGVGIDWKSGGIGN